MRTLIAFVAVGLVVGGPAARADDAGRLCDIVSSQIGDCACVAEFVTRNMSADDATVIMQLWAAGTDDPRRPSAASLHDKYGDALLRASTAFMWKRLDFLRACPKTTLILEDGDMLRGEDNWSTGSVERQ